MSSMETIFRKDKKMKGRLDEIFHLVDKNSIPEAEEMIQEERRKIEEEGGWGLIRDTYLPELVYAQALIAFLECKGETNDN